MKNILTVSILLTAAVFADTSAPTSTPAPAAASVARVKPAPAPRVASAPKPAAAPASAPAPTDLDAIHALYPRLAPSRDFTLAPDGSLATWKLQDKRFPQPTAAQLATAKAQLTAQRQTLMQVKSALAAKSAALAPGEQAFYRPVLDAAKIKLGAGDLAGAKQIIATAPAPTASLHTAQAAMLNAFPQ